MHSARENPPAVALRPMRATDIDVGLRLCRASGWNQLRRDWEQFLALGPDGSWVAEQEGQVVGTVTTVRYGTRFAWIGMVLVDPAVRGRGIGTRLLDRAIALLSDVPRLCLDATAAGHALYLSRGFTDETQIHRLQGGPTLLAQPSPGGVRPMREQDLAEVCGFDEPVFGADRVGMLRWMWHGAPEYAWVAERGGRLTGYAFGRHGHHSEHLGPVVAEDGETARHLAATCLSAHRGRTFIVDVPLGQRSWRESLEALGFSHQRPLIRMARGGGSVQGDPSRGFAVLGPEFG